MLKMLRNYFEFDTHNTTFGTEIRAGITTFLTMSYILFINPQILSSAIHIEGKDLIPQLMSATALSAAFGTLLMGLFARYPYVIAPGMGLNAYFAYTVVLGQGHSWQTALGGVFISGIIFIFLSFARIRELVITAIPVCLRRATAAGIGVFLALIGCMSSGLVVSHPVTLVTIGNFHDPQLWLAAIGLGLMAVFNIFKIRGAILISIVATALIAIVWQLPVYNGKVFGGLPGGNIFATPVLPTDLFGAMDIAGAINMGFIGIIFTFTFIDIFDTAGTLVGISEKAGFLTPDGRLPRATAAFSSDAIATSVGAVFGTSTTTTYIESAAGIEDGGRTGMTAIVAAIAFLLSLFLWPLTSAIPAAATAPALIIVGVAMMDSTAKIHWDDYRQSIPAFLTIIGMPFTYSIAHGVSLGVLSYTLLHVLTGKGRQVHWFTYVLSLILVTKFIWEV